MAGHINFRWGSFYLKLEVMLPFLRVKNDLRATISFELKSSSRGHQGEANCRKSQDR